MLPFLGLFDLRELHQGRTLLKLCHIHRYHSTDCVWGAAAGDFSVLFYLFYCMFLHRGGKKEEFLSRLSCAIALQGHCCIWCWRPCPCLWRSHAHDISVAWHWSPSSILQPNISAEGIWTKYQTAKGHNLQVCRLLIWCDWSALKKDTIHLQWCRGST